VRTFRFSELTLIVTSERLVKHVGSAVWDAEFEEFHYADLTGLDFEEGTVATAVVLVHDGRSERFKAPNESARAVRETLADAVCSFHEVDSLEEFRVAAEAEEAATDAESGGTTDFGEGPDPLSASPAADAEAEAPEAGGADGTADSAAEGDPLAGDDGPAAAEESESPTKGSEPGDGLLDADPLAADAAVDDATADPPADDATATESAESVDADAGEAGSVAEGLDAEPESAPEPESAIDAEAVAADAEPDAAVPDDDAFDGSPFESAGVEDADLASEVAALRRTVEAQSERLDRQSALIEQLIEELRRGR
jgi:hypothetical protein